MKQYIKDGVIEYANRIVISKDGMRTYSPTEEMILADGWAEYIPPVVEPKKSAYQITQEIVLEQYNQRADISDSEALDRMIVIFDWERYIGKALKQGQVCVYNDKVWRSRQEHAVLEEYPPSMDTASLYEVIEIIPTGEKDDPIPYTPPMEIFEGKYYSEENLLYLCNRDSGTALTHRLADLVDIYVERV